MTILSVSRGLPWSTTETRATENYGMTPYDFEALEKGSFGPYAIPTRRIWQTGVVNVGVLWYPWGVPLARD